MASLATSGNLSAAPLLHNRLYSCQVLDGDQWVDLGPLALFENTAFLNDEKLYNVHYHEPTSSVRYSFGKGDNYRAGSLNFTDDHLAFVGTTNWRGMDSVAVRGNLDLTVFDTQRKLKSDSTAPYEAWQTFTLGTEWVDQQSSKVLVPVFKLGDRDISNRTAVTKVVKWQTTIEMVESQDMMSPGKDKFEIVVDPLGQQFSGTYTDRSGTVYDWKGTAQRASVAQNSARVADFALKDGPPLDQVVPPAEFRALLGGSNEGGPDLHIQDLLTVSALQNVTENGKTFTRDNAQIKTGQYLQDMLIDSLDQKWIVDFFGDRRILTTNVEKIRVKHEPFYKKIAVMNLGQMIHDNFGTDERHKQIVARIDAEKLKKAWKDLGTDKDYAAQSTELYVEGYRDGVPGIRPYLENNPKGWAKQLFDTLTSDQFIQMWKIQISSKNFSDVQKQIYEWWVQLTVLDPDANYPTRMLHTMFAAATTTKFSDVKWQADMVPYLAEAIENMLKGDPELARKMGLTEHVAETQQTLQRVINSFQSTEQFVGFLVNFLTIWAGLSKNADAPIMNAPDDYILWQDEPTMAEKIWEKFSGAASGGKKFWGETGAKICNLFKSIFYAAGAGFLIYQIVSGGIRGTLNPIEGIGLGILAIGLLVKTVESLVALGVGAWLMEKWGPTGATKDAFETMGKWFRGELQTDNIWTKVLGKSSADSFAKRLGPIAAMLGLGLAIWILTTAVKGGVVSEIVFSTVNTLFATVQAGLGIVELVINVMSWQEIWWMGPVGLLVALLGLIVLVFQWIWNTYISPKPPPVDPIEEFVTGPLKDAGYVTAAT